MQRASTGGGSATAPIGGRETSGSGGLVEPIDGGASFSWSGAGMVGTLQGGTGNPPTTPLVMGGSPGTWINDECWGVPEGSTALMACPATYCEVRAQMVGYCGNLVPNRQPPTVTYAYQRRCGTVKDVVVSIAAYGYSCRYQANALVGVMDYNDKNDYCAGRSSSIQSGVPLTDCSANRITFCDARTGVGGAAGSSAVGIGGVQASAGRPSTTFVGAAGSPTSNAAGAFAGGGAAGATGTLDAGGKAGAGGAEQPNIGLCYDAITDTCQPC